MPDKTPERRVIQISSGSTRDDDTVIALADDGTIWRMDLPERGDPPRKWELLPRVPET
jgi:hypothetical protein